MSKDDWQEWLDSNRKDALKEFFENDGTAKGDGKTEGNWEKLKRANWEELAFYVWYDAVREKDPKGIEHSKKWAGMLTARLLAKLDAGGKWMAVLAVFQVVLAIVQIILAIKLARG